MKSCESCYIVINKRPRYRHISSNAFWFHLFFYANAKPLSPISRVLTAILLLFLFIIINAFQWEINTRDIKFTNLDRYIVQISVSHARDISFGNNEIAHIATRLIDWCGLWNVWHLTSAYIIQMDGLIFMTLSFAKINFGNSFCVHCRNT